MTMTANQHAALLQARWFAGYLNRCAARVQADTSPTPKEPRP